jgi:chromate reductase, NAD(P)H dehydrogenase (quinone)
MAGRIVPEASTTVSLLGKNLDAAGIMADPEISGELKSAISSFANAIEQFQKQ